MWLLASCRELQWRTFSLRDTQPYIEEIFTRLRGDIFRKFVESDKYTRFCQWKNLELNIQVRSGIEVKRREGNRPREWDAGCGNDCIM